MYNFNLSTKEEPEDKKCNKDEQLLVDLEIDGKNGPIPKLVEEKPKKMKIWMENDENDIDDFETTREKADAISELAEKLKGTISSSETTAAQIASE